MRYPNSKAGMPATVAPTAASAVDPSGPENDAFHLFFQDFKQTQTCSIEKQS